MNPAELPESADEAVTTLPAGLVPDVNKASNLLHSCHYFAAENGEAYAAIGVKPGRMAYFAARSAAMGAVGAGVVAATFYNFNPEFITRYVPAVWAIASPQQVLAVRHRVVEDCLRRLLGDRAGTSAVAEAAELGRGACAGLDPAGRPLFAAHAELPWPADPLLSLWHAITLLREYRGDGHIAALLAAGLSGIEALVTHTATGDGFTVPVAQALRGWTPEQWAVATGALQQQGLLAPANTDDDPNTGLALTPAGQALRDRVEAATDRMAAAPYEHLGIEATLRFTEICRDLLRTALANGALPPGMMARG